MIARRLAAAQRDRRTRCSTSRRWSAAGSTWRCSRRCSTTTAARRARGGDCRPGWSARRTSSTASSSPTRSCATRSTSARARAGACACTGGSARRWRRTGDANPAELAYHFPRAAAHEGGRATRWPRPSRPPPRSPTRRRPSTTGARWSSRGSTSCSRSAPPSCAPATRRRARRSPPPRELARERNDRGALAEAALGFAGRHAEAGVVDHDGIALLEEALARVRRRGPSARRPAARRGWSTALHFAQAEERTLALSAEALAMAQRLGDPRALLVALESRHAALLHVDHLDERLRPERGAARAGGADRRVASWRRSATTGGSTTCSRPAAGRRRPHARTAGWRRSPPSCASRSTTTSRSAGRSCGRRWRAASATPSGSRARRSSSAAQAQSRDAETIFAAQMLILRRREDALRRLRRRRSSGYVEQHPRLLAWRADPADGAPDVRRHAGRRGPVPRAGAGRVRGDPARHVLVHRDRAAGRDVRADRRPRAGAGAVPPARAAPRTARAGHAGREPRLHAPLPRAAERRAGRPRRRRAPLRRRAGAQRRVRAAAGRGADAARVRRDADRARRRERARATCCSRRCARPRRAGCRSSSAACSCGCRNSKPAIDGQRCRARTTPGTYAEDAHVHAVDHVAAG